MGSATNVEATAVNTIEWLSHASTAIVVPVYQRQYRWDIGGCEKLLADVRAAADADSMHFIGSILSAEATHDAGGELVLIDGQQRMTTLMLLIAALHHTVRDTDAPLAAALRSVLVRAGDPQQTKLRPHREWADVFGAVVRGEPHDDRQSRFDDNYAFFRSQVGPDDVARVWRGIQKLEHVSITLRPGANAQQIFESLNSTGEPLRDHELIHNYVLMGLTHKQQTSVEDEFWLPIERATGEQIAGFWRHYLIMTTGREVTVAGERGVYDAFRAQVPRVDFDTLRALAADWVACAEVYRTLLDPSREQDADISRALTQLNTFGRGMYPLVMRAYGDHGAGLLDRAGLLALLQNVQTLLLRRELVGLPCDRLVARLCRARADGPDALTHAMSRITPSDERVRVAVKYGDLPHARYVLGRLAGADASDALDVEHVFPLAPGDDWSGDGVRRWKELSDDEQNSHRALAQSLGNTTLLEPALAAGVFGASYADKRVAYGRSGVSLTRAVAELPTWSTASIAARTAALTEDLLRVWRRPLTTLIDDDGLTPVLDAKRRRGWPRGWQREFAYVEYRGEHWEVHDVKHLFNRVFRRLWADAHDDVVAFSTRRGGPIFPERAWHGEWDELAASTFLYMGWDSKYMLTAVQGVLDEAGLAPEVFVKYSYIGAAM